MFVPMARKASAASRCRYPLFVFPIILLLSLAGCLMGTLFTEPEEEAILMEFYRTVRPWGFWTPIRAKVQREDPVLCPES